MTHIIDNLTAELKMTTDQLVYNRNTPNVTVTTTTLNGTLALTVTSYSYHVIIGTATGYVVTLPNATTLTNGWIFNFFNKSTQTVDVRDGANNFLFRISSLSVGIFILQSNTTIAGDWAYWQVFSGSSAGLVTYKVTDSNVFTTTSLTYVAITNMSVTPMAGVYEVWFNGLSDMTSGNKAHHFAIFNNGVIVTDSERNQTASASGAGMIDSTITTITAVGGQAIDVRAYSDSGTSLSFRGKTLLLTRVSD